MRTNQALEAARSLALNPSLIHVMRQAKVPEDIETILRFLAGDLSLSQIMRGNPEQVRDIVERYVVAIMLYPGARPERVLGLKADASRDDMRRHMRWLMIWLHPDLNSNSWRDPYSARVLDAWRHLSSASKSEPVSLSVPAHPGRPQTRPVKLAWIAQPHTRQKASRVSTWLTASIILVSSAILIMFVDNPLREWAGSVISAHTSLLME